MRFNLNQTTLKVRRQKFGIPSLIFLLVFGGLFTGAGVLILNANRVDPDWKVVTGEIVDVSSSISDGSTIYTPIVEYKVSDRVYKITGGISSSAYPDIGTKREVAYNPERPDQSKVIETLRTQWFVYLFPAVGLICLIGAPYAYFRTMRRSNHIKRLLENGLKIQGVITDMKSQSNKDSGTYVIVVSAPDPSGIVQNYVSDPLTGIGGLAMADFRNNPIPVDVFIDPANYDDYYVDVTDIPNLTPERILDLIKMATERNQSNSVVSDNDTNV